MKMHFDFKGPPILLCGAVTFVVERPGRPRKMGVAGLEQARWRRKE